MADDLDDGWWSNDAGKETKKLKRTHAESVNGFQPSLPRRRNKLFDVESVNGWQPSFNKKLRRTKRRDGDEIGRVKKPRKKKKTKTEELAENLNPIAPMKEFNDVMRARQQELTVFERDEFSLDALTVVQENVDSDFETTFRTSLARCTGLFSRAAKATGRPFVLFLTGSAIRATELKRKLKNISSECKIAKLFAKHMKIENQVSFLSKTPINVAVGTPKRVYELIELKALKLAKLKYVLLDWTWRDRKLRRMVDISEVKQELLSLLFKYLFVNSEKRNVQLVLL